MTGARDDAIPRVIGRDGSVPLAPIDLDDERIDEGWLRSLLHAYPEVVPIERIGLRWGPLVSIGSEIPVGGVTISNLFVSPAGELTVVEPTLWRNPPTRVDAVRRIVAIASALAELTFAEFEAWVFEGVTSSERSVWALLQESEPEQVAGLSEAAFVDTVSANLAAGSFLLVIAGDGIRSDFDEVAAVVSDHPNLHFHLELVELRAFHWTEPTAWVQEDRILVVPSLVGRTAEITRAVHQAPTGLAVTGQKTLDLRSVAVEEAPPLPFPPVPRSDAP